MRIYVIYDTNILVEKYNMVPGYQEIFTLIKSDPDLHLVICHSIHQEYLTTLSRACYQTVHFALKNELGNLGNQVVYPNDGDPGPEIMDVNDQKFVNCALMLGKPVVIVTNNIDDFRLKKGQTNEKSDGTLQIKNSLVTTGTQWLNTKNRVKILEDVKDYARRRKFK